MVELISYEPLRDDSHASEGEMPAEQTVETGEIVCEAVFARTDAGSESAYGPPGRLLKRMEGSAT